MRSVLIRYGLSLLALIPFAVCVVAFTDLAFWQSLALYVAVGFYAGCTSVIDREVP